MLYVPVRGLVAITRHWRDFLFLCALRRQQAFTASRDVGMVPVLGVQTRFRYRGREKGDSLLTEDDVVYRPPAPFNTPSIKSTKLLLAQV